MNGADGSDLDACAAQVSRADPDRFAAAMTAPPAMRTRLLPLYAFNLEVARAPWVTEEPLIAKMRLQWWTDAIAEIFEGKMVRRHEVVLPLAATVAEAGLPRAPFDALIAARERDIEAAPFVEMAEARAYLDATSGGLTVLAALALGAGSDLAARAQGIGEGAARLIQALPDLAQRRGGALRPEAIGMLADLGLDALQSARAHRATVPRSAAPAFRCTPGAKAVLLAARKDPAKPPLTLSPARRQAIRLRQVLTGGW